MKNLFLFVVLVVAALSSPADAQSGCPAITFGAVLTPGQWQACFSAKQDLATASVPEGASGTVQYNKAGALAGATGALSNGLGITFTASSTIGALNVTPTAAPSAPNNGDIWSTAAGLFIQIDGAAVGPLSSSANSTRVVDTIAEMEALGANSGVTPTVLALDYGFGSGGGGLFVLNTSTATVDGCTIFPVDGVSSERWVRKLNNQPITFQDCGAAGNTVRSDGTATIGSGSPNLAFTSGVPSVSFASGDVGKYISVAGAGAGGATLSTTILSVTNATHVVLAANASTALTSATGTIVAYGTNDTVAMTNAINYARAVPYQSVAVPCGEYLDTAPLPYAAPLAGQSANCGTLYAAAAFSGASDSVLDFAPTNGTEDQYISQIAVDVRDAPASTSCIGSSSTSVNNVAIGSIVGLICTGASTTTPAVNCLSETGAGMCTGVSFVNLYVAAPCPIGVGTDENQVVFQVPRIFIENGCSTVPVSLIGPGIKMTQCYVDAVGTPSSARTPLVEISSNVDLDGCQFEGTSGVDWGIEYASGSTGPAYITNTVWDLALTGGDADGNAFLRANTEGASGAGLSYGVTVDGFSVASGRAPAYAFSIFNSNAGAADPLVLHVRNISAFPGFAITGSGGMSSSSTLVEVFGDFNGAPLQHGCEIPGGATSFAGDCTPITLPSTWP